VVSGPEEATGVRYAQGRKQETGDREQGVGNVDGKNDDSVKNAPNGAVSCTSREDLVAVLRRLKEDGKLRWELAERTVDAGRRDFDPNEINRRFHQVLEEVCQ